MCAGGTVYIQVLVWYLETFSREKNVCHVSDNHKASIKNNLLMQ